MYRVDFMLRIHLYKWPIKQWHSFPALCMPFAKNNLLKWRFVWCVVHYFSVCQCDAGLARIRPQLQNLTHNPSAEEVPPRHARARPLIYIYDLPTIFNSRMLQYRAGAPHYSPLDDMSSRYVSPAHQPYRPKGPFLQLSIFRKYVAALDLLPSLYSHSSWSLQGRQNASIVNLLMITPLWLARSATTSRLRSMRCLRRATIGHWDRRRQICSMCLSMHLAMHGLYLAGQIFPGSMVLADRELLIWLICISRHRHVFISFHSQIHVLQSFAFSHTDYYGRFCSDYFEETLLFCIISSAQSLWNCEKLDWAGPVM